MVFTYYSKGYFNLMTLANNNGNYFKERLDINEMPDSENLLDTQLYFTTGKYMIFALYKNGTANVYILK